MTREEKEKKLAELLQNEEIAEKLENASSVTEVAELLRAQGLAITEEQTKKAEALAQKDELDEELLESVAGGYIMLWDPWRNRYSRNKHKNKKLPWWIVPILVL